MRSRNVIALLVSMVVVAALVQRVHVRGTESGEQERVYSDEINVDPAPVSSDTSVRFDYDIVYVRAPRKGDQEQTNWGEIANPALMEPGSDLMLLHPDGSEERLVRGAQGAVVDPYVSFDGQWIYFSYFEDLRDAGSFKQPRLGADIYKIHVKSRKIVRLTGQTYTPNTGAADWSSDFRTPEPGKTWLSYGVLNLGPCPLPGGRVAFVSNRNAFRPPKHTSPTLQLFVMDDDGRNVEQIGYLNMGMALHPTVLMDGRILFSSLESQGLRNSILWGIWSIHPDGTNWGPVVSAFDTGEAPNAFHFQTQLSDGSVVVEEYYNQNNNGFGGFFKFPPQPPDGYPSFGPADRDDPRNPPLRVGRFDDGKPILYRLPFSPFGIESLTQFARIDDGPANPSVLGKFDSPRVGKVTHPSGAPDNHLLLAWSPGPVNRQGGLKVPATDSGLYLLKSGKPIDEPGQLLKIKNDPRYNEQWPRALVPYRRIYGIDEPKRIAPLANDGELSPELPAGTPFGMVGTSSLYKRESYPAGRVAAEEVTAAWRRKDSTNGFQGIDPFNTSSNSASLNWTNQGAEAGRYCNDDIHAIRILVMEPSTDRDQGPKSGRLFKSHASERLRILGEIPVRKFENGSEPLDPDGNPDTSFLAKIPADVAFTFQTLDRNGMVLNMAQTWHQVRPGEIRNNCGGCHAHSQKPTAFELTRAARKDYPVWDLSLRTPLLTTRSFDQTGRKWDGAGETGIRFQKGVKNVEYFRDVKPILDRSCVACHSTKAGSNIPGKLVLDDATLIKGTPGTYYRLALDHGDGGARFGYKPIIENGTWRQANASRYIRMFQSRRSLLIWKVFGRRTDGWSNDDFPTETIPGDASTLAWKGQRLEPTAENRNRADLDYTGSPMPPPEAVAGTYMGPGGERIKVPPLSDEDRLTLVRWIDLGCPIDLDYDPSNPDKPGHGWMLDDQRPTLTVTTIHSKAESSATRFLIGMYDYGTGLNMESFRIMAEVALDGIPAGENLASRFEPVNPGVWEWLAKQVPPRIKLTVSISDRQGNVTRLQRQLPSH